MIIIKISDRIEKIYWNKFYVYYWTFPPWWLFEIKLSLNDIAKLWQPCVASTTSMKFYTRSNRSTNSSPPSAAYMRHWTRPSLVQVMACRQFRTQASTWTNDSSLSIGLLGTNFSEIWIGILSFFIQENALENVIRQKMAAILMSQCIPRFLWNLILQAFRRLMAAN